MRRWVFLLVLTLFGCPPAARAFLGDDLATVEKCYGKPHLPASPSDGGGLAYSYHAAGYHITVVFKDGHSACETFCKAHTPKPLTEGAIHAFLDAHASGQSWRDMEHSPGRRVWRREGAMALYLEDNDPPRLVISCLDPPKPADPPAAPAPSPALAAASVPSAGKAPPAAAVQTVPTQCSATTRKGKRCTRMTTDPSGLCWQHLKAEAKK